MSDSDSDSSDIIYNITDSDFSDIPDVPYYELSIPRYGKAFAYGYETVLYNINDIMDDILGIDGDSNGPLVRLEDRIQKISRMYYELFDYDIYGWLSIQLQKYIIKDLSNIILEYI